MINIVKMGHPQLMQSAKPVQQDEFSTSELKSTVTKLWQHREYYDGAGIAAPQIGIFKQIAVVGFKHNERYKNKPPVPMTCLINPTVEMLTDEYEEDWEGCLSVPGLRAKVPRCKKIQYTYYDVEGVLHQEIAVDFHARIVQHEVDHLNGILFPARVKDFKTFGFEDTLPEFC